MGFIMWLLGSMRGSRQCPRSFQWFMGGGFIRRFHGFMMEFQIFLRGFLDFMMGFEVFSLVLMTGLIVNHHLSLSLFLQVATNGIISTQDLPMEKQYVDDGFPTDFPVVAPFLADIDTSGGRGQIYYRVTETPSVLNRVSQVCPSPEKRENKSSC